jgi:hypothetical protein
MYTQGADFSTSPVVVVKGGITNQTTYAMNNIAAVVKAGECLRSDVPLFGLN